MTARLAACLFLIAAPVMADPPEIRGASLDGDILSVTLAHPDTGWDHYADGWEVVDEAGNSLGLRELLHPHVNEQPFTRSLRVALPDGVTELRLRARCNVTGWSDVQTVPLD